MPGGWNLPNSFHIRSVQVAHAISAPTPNQPPGCRGAWNPTSRFDCAIYVQLGKRQSCPTKNHHPECRGPEIQQAGFALDSFKCLMPPTNQPPESRGAWNPQARFSTTLSSGRLAPDLHPPNHHPKCMASNKQDLVFAEFRWLMPAHHSPSIGIQSAEGMESDKQVSELAALRAGFKQFCIRAQSASRAQGTVSQ